MLVPKTDVFLSCAGMVFLWRSDDVVDLAFEVVGGAHPERDDHNMTDEGFLTQLHARPAKKFQCP